MAYSFWEIILISQSLERAFQGVYFLEMYDWLSESVDFAEN